MILALFLVAFLFILQTWLAAHWPRAGTRSSDDEVGNAFFTVVEASPFQQWLDDGILCSERARDRCCKRNGSAGRYLAAAVFNEPGPSAAEVPVPRINTRQVPRNAIILVSAISAILVLLFVGQINVISALVNFGALFGFLLLPTSVIVHYVVRKKSKNYLLHLVVPILGFLIIGYVLLNAAPEAKIGGAIWLVVGAAVFAYYKFTGRTPDLAENNGTNPELPIGQRRITQP